jgi:hypothetical protein
MNRTAKLSVLAAILIVCAASALMQRQIARDRQSVPPSALYEVVREQVRAFRADDFAGAYGQVSASFQERFNIESFSELARTEYPALLRAERVEFGAVRFEGRFALVPVYFFMTDGDVVPCVYILVNEDASWKIDAARVLKRWPAGRRLGGMRS